jgi:succinate-semialdehyde dehydrogenase/glutarate-semialdehyde dehydrogenase
MGDAGSFSPHPASLQHALKNHDLIREKAFIGGQWVSGNTTFPVYDPTTNEIIANVANMGLKDFQIAIDKAEAEFKLFSKVTEYARAQLLRDWASLIRKHLDDLSSILALENGKTLPEARAEVTSSAAMVSWFAEEAIRSYGDVIPSSFPNSNIVVVRQPIGVCGIIAPWNFPMAMITRKVAPAIAAGCTAVIKPPSETPLCALALAYLGVQAGLPVNALQVVPTKDRNAVQEIYTNPKVKKISFTGSTGVGKIITQIAAGTMKKISMELGGNSPFIIFDDADVDAAIDELMGCKYRCSGQTCICANRVFVQRAVSEDFLEKLTSKVAALRIGSPFDPAVTNGPLVNRAAVLKVRSLIDDALDKGAKLVIGGQVRDDLDGNFIEPAIMTNIKSNMSVAKEEIFGPLMPVIVFDEEEDMIELANSTEFGLAGYFFSSNYQRVWRTALALEVGMVGANTGKLAEAGSPFGGVKESGYGKEGSKYGLAEYQVFKSVTMGGMK